LAEQIISYLIAAAIVVTFLVWREHRKGWRWSGWPFKAKPPPQSQPQEILPPLPADNRTAAERLQALSASLETQSEQTVHPRDLLLFADFKAAVDILADPRCELELVRHYAAGRLWILSSAAFEALCRRPDRQQLADLGLSQLRTHSPGALHYVLRFLNSLEPRPPSGEPVTIAASWWVNHAMLIESFREYFEGRTSLGDPPKFGELIRAPGVELEEIDRFLERVDHPYASALRDELARIRSARIDEAKLTAFGRFWTRQPDSLLVEPAPWSEALGAAREAVLGPQHRSILVTGGPRVGKSSFLRLLGRRLGDEGWRVFEATAAELMADQMYIGQLEGRIRETVAELQVGKKVAWCVGDLQQLARSGTHSGQSASVLDQMWPAISAGRLLILAEADPDGASRTLQMRPALRALLEVVRLSPFDDGQLGQFAGRVADKLQERDNAAIGPEARDAALHYAQQYLGASDAPGAVADVLKRAVEKAAASRPGGALTPVAVGAEQVIEAVAQMTGLPADILNEDDPIDLDQVRAYFSRRVMGQDHAVAVVVDRIAMLKAGLVDPNKPIAVLLFAGPTGTGKTELAKTLAAFLFGSADRLVRLDMSEFQTGDSVSKIVGERGQSAVSDPLVEQIRKQPFSVVLLDEFEKAHSNVWDLFLQVFDDGRLTDANGHTADFRHAIIILTSNLGATSHRSSGMGFNPSKSGFADNQVVAAIEKAFRPEFVNRLDRVVVFQPLTRELLYRILHKELAEVLDRRGLRNREWAVEWEPSALDFLLDRGFSPELGARPLKRAIDQYLLAPLAATLVEHRFPEGDQFLFVRSNGAALEVEFVDPDGGDPAAARPAADETDVGERRLADLVLHPGAALDSPAFLLRRCEALEAALASAEWLQRKARLEQRASAADIWDSPDRVAVFSQINLIDRVKEASGTVRRLAERLKPSAGHPERWSPDLAGRLALQLWLVEHGVQDVVSGAPGEAALLVESALEGAADRSETQAWVQRVLGMYAAWAEQRRMQLRVLAPEGQPAILSVSGFGAWRTLSAEAGLHVLESGSGDAKRLTARVRVALEPPDDTLPSHAKLLQALKATPASRSVVRRYRDGEAPLVRDVASGKRSGQLDRVLGGAFDLVFDIEPEASALTTAASAEY
jgi:ATP-dependent Clp protease ATP-binding subunit ClpC